MKFLRLLSVTDQVTTHLREAILSGDLSGDMPGAKRLATLLGVNHKTVDAALQQLECEGLLRTQGNGQPRQIVRPDKTAPATLRVRILLHDPGDRKVHFMLDARASLQSAGHAAEFADKTLIELGMNPRRVARFVEKNPADAWVVQAGSREILEWFASQRFPGFALFGRLRSMPLAGAGVIKDPALSRAVRRLAALGHRRIVMLVSEKHRQPHPSPLARTFLDELDAVGIRPGPYNLPDWEENRDSLHARLDSLFQHTPPTAMLISETRFTFAVFDFLSRRGLRIPEDVSMISLDPAASFAWFDPKIAHITYDSQPWMRRLVNWADNVSLGQHDHEKELTDAEFVEGGTIGPCNQKTS